MYILRKQVTPVIDSDDEEAVAAEKAEKAKIEADNAAKAVDSKEEIKS